MTTGTIKKVVSDRGFGFIAAEDGKEYFFHRDGLDRSLEFDRLVGGEKVNFEVESSPRGPRAGKVSAASHRPAPGRASAWVAIRTTPGPQGSGVVLSGSPRN